MTRLIFFVLINQILYGQILWKGSVESGYYNSSGNFLQTEEEILTRINLKGGYNYLASNIAGKIDFQLSPEIYGFKNKLQTTKIAVEGYYSQSENELDWILRINANRYIFSGEIADFSYDSFLFNGQILWPFQPKISLDTRAGFAYRNFNQRDAISLDIIFSEIDFVYSYNSYTKISFGLYLEKFNLVKSMVSFFDFANSKNRGIRIGPTCKFNHTRNFMFSMDYQLLIHDSDFTLYPSYDQWLRIIIGKNIIKNLSAFILGDYYQRNFKYIEENKITELLYSPVNFENRIYFKLSKTIKPHQKVFLKIGYFDEKLFYRDYSLSGWKGYIGFEIKG